MPHKDPEVRKAYNRAYARKYRAANHERVIEYERRSDRKQYSGRIASLRTKRATNGEVIRAMEREVYRRNRVRKIAATKRWRERNRDKVSVVRRLREARKKAAGGRCTPAQWRERYALYGGCCSYCGCSLKFEDATIDHIVPVALGGSSWPSNLVPACFRCNSAKGAKLISPNPPPACARVLNPVLGND